MICLMTSVSVRIHASTRYVTYRDKEEAIHIGMQSLMNTTHHKDDANITYSDINTTSQRW